MAQGSAHGRKGLLLGGWGSSPGKAHEAEANRTNFLSEDFGHFVKSVYGNG